MGDTELLEIKSGHPGGTDSSWSWCMNSEHPESYRTDDFILNEAGGFCVDPSGYIYTKTSPSSFHSCGF